MITEKTVWNTKTEKYTKEHDSSHNDPSRQIIVDFLKKIEDSDPDRVVVLLELGPGSGTLLDNIETNGLSVDYRGVDASKKFIEVVKNRHPDREVVLHDFDETLPFPDSCFDIAYARHVLEHVAHYEPVIREMARVANEIIIVFFRPLLDGDKDEINRKDKKGTYYNSYSRDGVLKLCNSLFSYGRVIECDGNTIGPKGRNWVLHCAK